MSRMDFVNEIAAKKVGVEGWEPFAWEVVGSDVTKVTGGIPRILARGPRKGQKTFDKPHRVEYVADSEVVRARAAYEHKTGNCSECMGTGQVFASWSAASGVRKRQCGICDGTGKAKNAVREGE